MRKPIETTIQTLMQRKQGLDGSFCCGMGREQSYVAINKLQRRKTMILQYSRYSKYIYRSESSYSE